MKYLICLFILFCSCNKDSSYSKQEDEIELLLQDLVTRVLQDDLWNSRDCYDSGHMLMLPLHYVFKIHDDKMINNFGNHFERYYLYMKKNGSDFNSYSYLNKLHYWYLLTWYYVLLDDIEKINMELVGYIEEEVTRKYKFYNGNWGVMKSYINSMPENFDFILSKEEKTYKYLRAIVDTHFFTLSIFSNIAVIRRKMKSSENELLYREVENYAYDLLKSEVVWNRKGGWVLQPGVWSDHPDFRFAGSMDREPVLTMVDDIGEDISHFFRYPLFLMSFKNASSSLEKESYYNSLILGLCNQLNNDCIVRPTKAVPYYRFTNYISGCNGWFRYNDKTGKGYGPYQLTSSLTVGWYSLLGKDEGLHTMYEYTYNKMPFDNFGKEVYKEPVSTRERNPIFIMPEYRKLLCGLASNMTK